MVLFLLEQKFIFSQSESLHWNNLTSVVNWVTLLAKRNQNLPLNYSILEV